MKDIHWVARCAYDGKEAFVFDSPSFCCDCWADLEDVAAQAVAESWAAISPHPPPRVVELIPGRLSFTPCKEDIDAQRNRKTQAFG